MQWILHQWHKTPREKGLFSQFVCVWWPWPRSWEQESGQSLATGGAVERPQNPLCWLSKGFRCWSQKRHLGSPSLLLCQKQCLRVVWRISTQRRCDKNVRILALTRVCIFLCVENNGRRSDGACETFLYFFINGKPLLREGFCWSSWQTQVFCVRYPNIFSATDLKGWGGRLK